MEAVRTSETSFYYETIWHYIPEGSNRRENLNFIQAYFCWYPRWYMRVEETVEWYWQGKNRRTPRKTYPSATLSTTNQHGHTRERTGASAVRDRLPTTWVTSRPTLLMFISMRWGDVSELRPLTGPLFIPQMIYESGEPQWNDTDRGKPKNSEKNLPQCHFFHQK
jgi:hypothetical protein